MKRNTRQKQENNNFKKQLFSRMSIAHTVLKNVVCTHDLYSYDTHVTKIKDNNKMAVDNST